MKKEDHTARLSNLPATVLPAINSYDFMKVNFYKAFTVKLLALKSAAKTSLLQLWITGWVRLIRSLSSASFSFELSGFSN